MKVEPLTWGVIEYNRHINLYLLILIPCPLVIPNNVTNLNTVEPFVTLFDYYRLLLAVAL